MGRKLKIAWFTPLGDQAERGGSKAAYTSRVVLPYLSEIFEIDLYSAKRERTLNVDNYIRAAERDSQDPYDLFFYLLEDHPSCEFSRLHLALKPGIVYFHDLNFTTFGPDPIINSTWHPVVERFNGPSERWPARGVEHPQNGPFASRELAFAALPIFCDGLHQEEYQRRCRHTLVRERRSYRVPVPVEHRGIRIERQRDLSALRICYPGAPRIEDRCHKVLAAVAELPERMKFTWLIREDEEQEARGKLNEYQITAAELVVGRTAERWREIVSRSDLALHPRFSVFGSSSPYLEISLMHGLPVITTKFGSGEFLPRDLVFGLSTGDSESVQMREIILALAADRVTINRGAIAAYAEELHSAPAVAGELAKIIQSNSQYLADFRQAWRDFEVEANSALLAEQDQLCSAEAIEIVRPIFNELGWR